MSNLKSIETTNKRKYITIGRDGVAQRRAQVAVAARDFLTASGGPVRQAEVFKAVTETTGLPASPSVWNDLTKALEDFEKSNTAAKNKPEGKRATYSFLKTEE